METKTAQKDAIAFEATFPHDTQLALLSLAQRRLAAALSRRAPDRALPFSFMIPFCPVPFPVADDGRSLTVGPAAIYAGWIVAPVAAGESGRETGGIDRFPDIPGYPAIPRASAFILGYAGPLAEAILAEAVAAELKATGSGGQSVLTATVSIRARYRATVEIAIAIAQDSRFFSASYAIGPARWER